MLFTLVVLILQFPAFYKGQRSRSGWGPWSEWICSATCGGGGGRKTRVCVDPGPNKCLGGKQKFGKCNEQPCPDAPKPQDTKGWTPWMPWECPVSCGEGAGTRTRICEDPDICEGPEEEKGPCAEEACPVDPDSLDSQLRDQIEQQLKTSKYNVLAQKGETVSVTCKDGLSNAIDQEYPDAKVKWIKNGQLVRIDGKRIELESNGDLMIRASVEDNGIWWCSLQLTPKVSVTASFVAFAVQNDRPDIEVEAGHQFQLKCLATSLRRLVSGRFDQTWVHNSSTYKERPDVRPDEAEGFRVASSNYSHSGIWNCRYAERESNLPTKREWVTNVVRVLVVPPESRLQIFLPHILTLLACVLLVSAVGVVYWRRLKKKIEEGLEEEKDDEGEWYEN